MEEFVEHVIRCTSAALEAMDGTDDTAELAVLELNNIVHETGWIACEECISLDDLIPGFNDLWRILKAVWGEDPWGPGSPEGNDVVLQDLTRLLEALRTIAKRALAQDVP